MRFDFSVLPIKNRAFSEKPMTFIDPSPKNFLGAIVDLVMIETGNPTAREHWQHKQLHNLLQHAAQRSAFWRKRIGAKKIKDINLSDLPVLTRGEVVKQVAAEGCLLTTGDSIRTKNDSTSGSSGTPVHFFISEMNTHYNVVRSAAQYFIEGRDLTRNRTQLYYKSTTHENGFAVVKKDNWLSDLGALIKSGKNKQIDYFNPNSALLCEELRLDPIGYLVAGPYIVEAILQHSGCEFFRNAGTALWIPIGYSASPQLRDMFSSIGVPVRAHYSCREMGMIGSECEEVPGHYHITTSNVIVEMKYDDNIQIGGKRLGRVLVTHLHSYATPFIRYDIGDLASMTDACSCGHAGPVLANIHGRTKQLLKHPDGRLSPFYIVGKEMSGIAEFTEYRIRQTAIDIIVVEICGRESLTPDEISAFSDLIKSHASGEFKIDVQAVSKIDWGQNIKRLGFHNEVL